MEEKLRVAMEFNERKLPSIPLDSPLIIITFSISIEWTREEKFRNHFFHGENFFSSTSFWLLLMVNELNFLRTEKLP
jgi:hypothetical protein